MYDDGLALPAAAPDDDALFRAARRLGVEVMRTPDLARIDTWIFDLDNTLYPANAAIWGQIDHAITAYIAHMFGIDGLSARALQKHYYKRYGTTLNGLMAEHPETLDSHHFLDFVHDIDRSSLLVNPALASAIERLPGRRLVFTNGSRSHAEKTMLALGIAHLFDDVFDIVAAGFTPKPHRAPYDQFLSQHGIDARRAIMFEDIALNLETAKATGMETVLVVPRTGDKDHRESWEITTSAPAYVDHVTDDLPAFLDAVVTRLRPAAGG